ncbi:uncharacterized protein N7496_002117 [Penicillium cataractarum]|uniref:Transcription factor IIIC subunit delta N-term-domain-containing protein n=1 Tax=Penicillium cataractarum TaxID=2100454 RepID=A0A9W9VGB0_9EURO|nr:uncharacterized protein N7496_002117 [Penicillium cataractarum]KAJ5379689.1 hypothetical protein N7496_002117 [Penicillium cataractarum]
MPSPVDLAFSPSCFESLSWSADGDLAVAAGEYVQILTPKKLDTDSSGPKNQDEWNITRIRVNLFTVAEWQFIQPQNRDDFSLAAEQSTGTVVGVAWSPPGLGRFRRSVLAVLTSNLLLSLWEPVGIQGQWTRVAIVNHIFHLDPTAPAQLTGLELRRSNIRSFQWCPPLLAPPSQNAGLAPEPESRWGVHLLVVTNDANEAILLRVRRLVDGKISSVPYSIDKLALYSLEDGQERYPQACSASLLRSALQGKARPLSVCCGPWLEVPRTSEDIFYSATAVIATVFGTQLRVFKTTVTLLASNPVDGVIIQYEATARLSDHPLSINSSKWTPRPVNGPLNWASTDQSAAITLTAPTNIGFLAVSIPRAVYVGSATPPDELDIHEWPLSILAEEDGEGPKRYMEPISGMTAFCDEKSGVLSLHLGTMSGLGIVLNLDGSRANNSPRLPQWRKIVEDRLEQFDLDRDLGGQSVARIWGLASYRGVVAVLFSRHPTDMIEYRVTSDEKSVLAFASEDSDYSPDIQTLLAPTISATESWSPADQREAVISYVLSSMDEIAEGDPESQRLIYALACCAIVDQKGEAIRSHARQSLIRLAVLTGADLTEEIARCDEKSPTLSAKSIEQLSGPGAHMFEKCEICDAGIAWVSATEAQCAEGHLFVRCGLSFLAIQEPGLSKYCSRCRAEYINEETIARIHEGNLCPLFRNLFEAFDTCLYCGGKFQASI